MSAIVSRLAEKPPTLTKPLARPDASFGMNVRARSKPTIEAGPPVAIRQTSTTSIHIGAGVERRQDDRPAERHRRHDPEHEPER